MTKIMTKIVEAVSVLSFAANFPRRHLQRLLKNGFSRPHYDDAQHNFIFILNHLHGVRDDAYLPNLSHGNHIYHRLNYLSFMRFLPSLKTRLSDLRYSQI